MRVLTVEQRRLALRLRAGGLTLREVGRRVGCSHEEVRVLERGGRVGARGWDPGPGRLSLAEREEISRGLVAGGSFRAIAAGLGRSVSTVSREVAANGGRRVYRGWLAHQRAFECARRPKAYKLSRPELVGQVAAWLADWWSPRQIAGRLRIDFAHDRLMQVSHETIYQSLFVQGRGELRRELARCLRSGRTARRARSAPGPAGPVRDKVMISERPAEAADRAVPGHWEGDLIIGANNASAIGTLVERTTRYTLLLHLPAGRGATAVEQAMRQAIGALPGRLFRSITWDQGSEMARHADFTIATGIPVYFCDPHAPWQRGSNENTNGLLRQYLPKSTDLSVHSAQDLAAIAESLNTRPRQTLGYLTPSEKLTELIAHTT
jgi:IS30 family transposase